MAVAAEVVTILHSDDDFSVNVYGILPAPLTFKQSKPPLIKSHIGSLSLCYGTNVLTKTFDPYLTGADCPRYAPGTSFTSWSSIRR